MRFLLFLFVSLFQHFCLVLFFSLSRDPHSKLVHQLDDEELNFKSRLQGAAGGVVGSDEDLFILEDGGLPIDDQPMDNFVDSSQAEHLQRIEALGKSKASSSTTTPLGIHMSRIRPSHAPRASASSIQTVFTTTATLTASSSSVASTSASIADVISSSTRVFCLLVLHSCFFLLLCLCYICSGSCFVSSHSSSDTASVFCCCCFCG